MARRTRTCPRAISSSGGEKVRRSPTKYELVIYSKQRGRLVWEIDRDDDRLRVSFGATGAIQAAVSPHRLQRILWAI
jgi:hypothetical protein